MMVKVMLMLMVIRVSDHNERLSKDIRRILSLYDSVQIQNERISKDIRRILSPRIRDQTKMSELARTFDEF